jgi:hypothetical protein
MKIDTITVTERKNKGNYEHIEISASAKVEEGENAMTAMLALKTYVETALMENKPIVKEEVKAEVAPEVVEEPKKEKKQKAKKEKVEEAPVQEAIVPEVVEEAPKKEKASKLVKYDSNIPGHKSIFGGYLADKYKEAWKTAKPKEEIMAFT